MGKIFGISGLPVSTIMSPFEHVSLRPVSRPHVSVKNGAVDNKFIGAYQRGANNRLLGILYGLIKQPGGKAPKRV